MKITSQYNAWTITLYWLTNYIILCLCSPEDSLPSLSDHLNMKAVFTQPLDQGTFKFGHDGFIPKDPVERIRKIHKEMIRTIKTISDTGKQSQYLLTLCGTANKDLVKLRRKIEESGLSPPETKIDKNTMKADAFILLISHAALMSNTVLFFPDIMKMLMKKNEFLENNIKWAVEFSSKAEITNDETLLKLFNLAQKELGLIEKDAKFQNPYKHHSAKHMEDPITTTTKKPRKKFARGPRMSGGEL